MAIKDKSQRQPKKIVSKLSYKISYIISLVIAIILLAFGLLSIPAVSIKFGIIFILSGLLFLFMFKSYRKIYKNYDYYKENGLNNYGKAKASESNNVIENNIDISNIPEITVDDIPEITVDDIPESHPLKKKAYEFKVVGVTFKTGRKSRQTALRHIHFNDEPYETVDIQIKEYDYEGELALGVYANDFQVGNIAKADINRVSSLLSDDYTIYDYKIYGGGDKNWGMSITLSKIVNS